MSLFRNCEPIVMKESDKAKRQLAELEAMRGTLPASAEKQLESDIRAIRAGIAGEERILFELRHSHMDMIVLQDLTLEHEGLTAQIDFLVLTRQRFFILECKNLYGNIEITEHGDFIRTFDGRKREGIYSPLTQNQRHIDLIHAMRKDDRSAIENLVFDRDFDDVYRSLIVLANPKTVLDDRKAPPEVKNAIVRADQLVARIQAVNAEKGPGHDKIFMSAMQKRAEWFLEQDKDAKGGDFAAKYREMVGAAAAAGPSSDAPGKRVEAPGKRADAPVAAPHAECAVTEEVGADGPGKSGVEKPRVDGVSCPRCGAPMVLRTAKRGEHAGRQFYGCSRYPKCRGIVNIEPGSER